MALGTTSITTTLVGNTLGVASKDVGTLCSSSLINKWSKYKPVRYNTTSPITDSQIKEVNYGFDIANMVKTDAVSAASINWNYLKPLGGANSPYRLGDFRSYEHTATHVYDLVDNYESINIYGILNVRIRFADTQGSGVKLNDFTSTTIPIGNWTPCIIVKRNTSLYCYKYSGETTPTGAKVITIDVNSEPFAGIINGTDLQFMYLLVETPSQISTSRFCPMPFADSNSCLKTVRIYNHLSISATISKLSDVYNTRYENISMYSGMAPEGAIHYPIPRNLGSVFFKLDVTNNSSDVQSFPIGSMKLKMSTLFTSYTNLEVIPSVYNDAFETINIGNNLVQYLNAGETRTYYIYIPNGLLMTNSSTVGAAVAAGLKIFSNINVYIDFYNNKVALCSINSLRLISQ